jgi:hypothetical protein
MTVKAETWVAPKRHDNLPEGTKAFDAKWDLDR